MPTAGDAAHVGLQGRNSFAGRQDAVSGGTGTIPANVMGEKAPACSFTICLRTLRGREGKAVLRVEGPTGKLFQENRPRGKPDRGKPDRGKPNRGIQV